MTRIFITALLCTTALGSGAAFAQTENECDRLLQVVEQNEGKELPVNVAVPGSGSQHRGGDPRRPAVTD